MLDWKTTITDQLLNRENSKMNNKEHETESKEYCSHCNDSGIVYQYNKEGVINMPCPECTEDVLSHIRNWDCNGQMFDG